MIEVRLKLWHEDERALFETFLRSLDAWRRGADAEIVVEPVPAMSTTVTEKDTSVCNSHTPDAPTQEAVDDALKAYAAALGTPAAVALLKEYGAKRTSEVPVDRRAEFIAAAGVGA